VTSTAPSRREGDTVLWTQTFALKQITPEKTPLPAVKVTFHDGPTTDTVEWSNYLRDVQVRLAPADVPVPPSTPSYWRQRIAVGLIVANLLLAGLVCLMRPRRRRLHMTPEQQIARELDVAAALMTTDVASAHEHLTDTVRRVLAERLHLPATRQTTAELMEWISRESSIAEEQREVVRAFLERCDLVKFAGMRPSAEECRATTAMAVATCDVKTKTVTP
jgi:hypothetical protein